MTTWGPFFSKLSGILYILSNQFLFRSSTVTVTFTCMLPQPVDLGLASASFVRITVPLRNPEDTYIYLCAHVPTTRYGIGGSILIGLTTYLIYLCQTIEIISSTIAPKPEQDPAATPKAKVKPVKAHKRDGIYVSPLIFPGRNTCNNLKCHKEISK